VRVCPGHDRQALCPSGDVWQGIDVQLCNLRHRLDVALSGGSRVGLPQKISTPVQSLGVVCLRIMHFRRDAMRGTGHARPCSTLEAPAKVLILVQVNPALEESEYSNMNAKNAPAHPTNPEKVGLNNGNGTAPANQGVRKV